MAREADGVLRLAAVVRYEVELARRRRRAHLVDVVPVVDIDFQRAVLAGLELRGLGDDDPGKRAAALAACPGSLDALHVVDNDDVAVAFPAVADDIPGGTNDNGPPFRALFAPPPGQRTTTHAVHVGLPRLP